MAFNESHFWFDGNRWILIRNMSYEALKALQYNINKEGYTSKKIDDEIEERHRYRNLCDAKVIQINQCKKIKKIKEDEEILNDILDIGYTTVSKPKEETTEIKEYNFD